MKLISLSDCLTQNYYHSGGNLHFTGSVAQHDCLWRPGSRESIWVRKDNPLTPKEDWKISRALMSCELVFISHHKNRTVCVAASMLQRDHRVPESIMGDCYCTGESGGRRRRRWGEYKGTREDVRLSVLFITPQILGFREMM